MKTLEKIQSELHAPKNQRNNFGKYNYRNCEDILESLKPLLAKHHATINLSDEVKEAGDLVFIESTATLTTEEGEYSSKAQAGINPNRKGMDIAQSFGSSSSYARKYALNGLLAIDDTKDADATNDHGSAPRQQAKPAPSSKTQQDNITNLADQLGLDADRLSKSLEWASDGNCSILSQLSQTEAAKLITELTRQIQKPKTK